MITDSRYNDNFLYFKEDGHKYTDTSGSEYLSVTTLIGNYVEPFNEKYWAHRKAKEQGRSEKSIKAEWNRIKNEACSRGVRLMKELNTLLKVLVNFKMQFNI